MTRHALRLTCLFAVLVSMPLAAIGESCPAVPESSTAARQQAGDLFAEAEQAYTQGQLDTALDLFVCSLRSQAHMNTLLNIAEVTRLNPNKAHSLDALESYLRDNPQSSLSKEVQSLTTELSSMLGKSAVTEPVPAAATPEPEASPDEPTSGRKVAGGVFLGVGLAGVAAGVVLEVIGLRKNSAASTTESASDFETLRGSSRKLQTGAIIAMAAGAALAVTGTILLVSSRHGEAKAADGGVVLSLSASPNQACLTLSF